METGEGRGKQGKTGENRERWGKQGKTVQRVSKLEILDVANKDPQAGAFFSLALQ